MGADVSARQPDFWHDLFDVYVMFLFMLSMATIVKALFHKPFDMEQLFRFNPRKTGRKKLSVQL